MPQFHISAHARLAVLKHFSPCEIIEDSTRHSRGGTEHRLHFWGEMNGEGVDVLICWGGIFNSPEVRALSLAPIGDAKLTPEDISDRVSAVLQRNTTKDDVQ